MKVTAYMHDPAGDAGQAAPAGNGVGVLCLHGFTSSPAFLRYTAQALRAAGFDVSCPTLAGHGTTPEDLEHTGRKDWLRSAEQALEVLQARHARVFLVGHSMGSTLALQLAARHPGITGLAVMAPSVQVSRRIRLLAAVLGRTRRWIPQQPMAVMDPATRADPALQGYPRMPTRAVRENLQQKADTRRLLGRVTAPALLVEGYHDPMAAKGSAQSIAAALASSRKYVFVAYQSSHGLPVDRDREFVHRLIIAFIKQTIGEQNPAGRGRAPRLAPAPS